MCQGRKVIQTNKKDDGVIYEIMKRVSNFEKRHFRD